MLKGDVYIITDPSIVMGLAATHTVICVSGEIDSYPDFMAATNAIPASILLPPYEAMIHELDGRKQESMYMYFEYLMSKEPRHFLAVLLRALYNGKSIVIYLTKDEEKMNYIKYFMEFIRMHYGISIGYNNTPCIFDVSFAPSIVTTLYLFNLMDCIEVLLNTTVENIDYVLINDEIVSKMAVELKPYVEHPSLAEYREFIKKYQKNIHTTGKQLIIPIGRI